MRGLGRTHFSLSFLTASDGASPSLIFFSLVFRTPRSCSSSAILSVFPSHLSHVCLLRGHCPCPGQSHARPGVRCHLHTDDPNLQLRLGSLCPPAELPACSAALCPDITVTSTAKPNSAPTPPGAHQQIAQPRSWERSQPLLLLTLQSS